MTSASNTNNNTATEDDSKFGTEPIADGTRILILGGCGFIGRHLLQYLVNQGSFHITCADKLIPQTAYMTQKMMALYKLPNVKLIQSDLTKDHHIQKIFNENEYEYIVNLCGETRCGQSDTEIKHKCVDSALKCMEAAANLKTLKKWIEISSAKVYEPAKKQPLKENANISPYTKVANARFEVEQLLAKTKLPFAILRPSIVYGPGDKMGLTPRLVSAACYKQANEKMKLLWTGSLGINTVHVRDVCSAVLLLCKRAKIGAIYNLSDKGFTNAGILNTHMEKLFGIQCGFQNKAVNMAAKKMTTKVAAYSNNKHVPMWNSVCKQYNITQTPLTPYMDIELLRNNSLLIDGGKIEREIGFVYEYPEVTCELLQEVIDEYVEQLYFPSFQ